jgi:ubiquinone biosynthesis monooxygenase Coq7
MTDYDQMIRVNLAGERGARTIYAGQLLALRLRNSSLTSTVEEMDQQEALHVQLFEALARDHLVRPTALQPLWSCAGWTLGVLSGFMGDEVAMACTAAVEEVIDQHYAEQCDSLDCNQDQEIYDVLRACQEDEQHHYQTAMDHGAEKAPFWFTEAVKRMTSCAIFLSKRF